MIREATTPEQQNQSLADKWLGRAPSLETRGLADWDRAIREMGMSGHRSFFRSVAARLSCLQEQGLVEGELLVTSADSLLKSGTAILSRAGLSTSDKLWCTIQSAHDATGGRFPSIKGERLTAEQLLSFVEYLNQRYPNARFEITAQPFIAISHQANVSVNSDRSVSIEVCHKGASISRGAELAFRSETPPFQSWPFRCSVDSPEAISITKLIISKIPRVYCSDGPGEEYRPGYYEFSVGCLPGTSIRRVVLNDFRNDTGFTR